MKIITYDAKYKDIFIEYNKEWIIEYFGTLEKEDEETFENIDSELENGAMIYFAIEDNEVLATCMSRCMQNDIWEMCKLASNKNRNHKGAGSAVFEAAMNWAIEHGAKKILLFSNSKLKPAIHIYEKFGFKELKIDDYGYARGNIAFEKIIE